MLQSEMLAVAIQANITTIIIGLPGNGKTAIVQNIAKYIEKTKFGGKGFPCVISNAAQEAPEDLAGANVPNHESRMMDAYPMGKLKKLVAAGRGVHVIDEYMSSEGPMRAACLSVMEGRLYGDTHLPGACVVALGNPPEIATNGQDMTAPESNRFWFLDWNLPFAVWKDYMLNGPGAIDNIRLLPDNWEEHIPAARQLIVHFLDNFQQYTYVYPKDGEVNGPWPSNRSWEHAASLLAAVRACGYPLSGPHTYMAIQGWVGKTVADLFFQWVKNADLPDPEEMLTSIERGRELVPTRPDHMQVTLEALAYAASNRLHPKWKERWEMAWKILGPASETRPDKAEPAARILSGAKPPGTQFPAECAKFLSIRRDIGASSTGIAR